MLITVATSRSAGLSTMPSAMTLKGRCGQECGECEHGGVDKDVLFQVLPPSPPSSSPAPLVHDREEYELGNVLVAHAGGLGRVGAQATGAAGLGRGEERRGEERRGEEKT